MNVDVYLLDWNKRRPWEAEEALEAARAGRYEYSFTVQALRAEPGLTPEEAAEFAYMAQGNNPHGSKVRRDRQTMSMGDAVIIDGKAYVAVSLGFEEVPELAELLSNRLEQSWLRWVDKDEPEVRDPDEYAAQLRAADRAQSPF